MKKYEISIKANPMFPYYMQHRMDDTKLEEWEHQRGRIIERGDIAKEDLVRAMFHAYIDEGNNYYMPSEHIRCALIEAGKYIKSKVGNTKKNMSNIIAGMFYVFPEKIGLPDNWEIDKRSAVNNNVKARVITIRPKWKDWGVNFEVVVDNDTLTDETVRQLIEFAGSYVGLGSFRPQHRGQFGRFIIDSFKPIN